MMIVIDSVPIEVRRTPDKTALVIQGRPYGMELKIGSLDELKRLALFFANEVGLWSDDLIEAEGVMPPSESGINSAVST